MDPVTLATTAATFLAPYVAKVGEKAVEKIGEKLPEAAGKMWNAVSGKFKSKEAAEESEKDLVANPNDQLMQSAFANQLRKILEAQPAFAVELQGLLDSAQREAGDTIINTGPGAVATHGGVAAGAGGVAVKGDVHGAISLGGSQKKD